MHIDPPRSRSLPWEWILLALSISFAGWFVGHGIYNVRTADRFVTVKGVSEREVKADLALWPIQFAVTDDNMATAQARINDNIAKVTAFLSSGGIDSSEVSLSGLRVTDVFANPYNPPNRVGNRFIIEQTVMVRTTRPELVDAASRRVGELVQSGVALSSGREWGFGGPTYIFRKLNDLKPGMIAEATAEARKAALEFAKNSKSRLGGIHRANQGVFVILPRDAASEGGPGMPEQNQMHKIVRVVTTVEYLLRG
ncbi:MAG TPA: SIMPL domain-containing protein [Candidatus Eisenbacteria bacterium]|nr:SIMPL domain-containing protein [Candidatus Eisenbacteria bacterium]